MYYFAVCLPELAAVSHFEPLSHFTFTLASWVLSSLADGLQKQSTTYS